MTSISKFIIFSRVTSNFNSDCEAIKINVNHVRRNFQKNAQKSSKLEIEHRKDADSMKENAREQKTINQKDSASKSSKNDEKDY
jgi:hypothetical protein